MNDIRKAELCVSKDLIISKKNGKMCMINGTNPRFLAFKEGSELIEKFLDAINEAVVFDNLPEELKDEKLLSLLTAHNIIELKKDNDSKPVVQQCNFDARPNNCSLYLNLTTKCTLRCIYCFANECSADDGSTGGPDYMSREVAFKAITSGFNIIPQGRGGRLEVVYFGGEPMMNWKLIKECILFCEGLNTAQKGKHIHHHITTNMTIFPNDFLEWIKRYNITLLVDVDGDEAMHNKQRPFADGSGSFKTIAGNLKRLQENGVNYSLRTTVTSKNVDMMAGIAKVHKELGGISTAFPLIVPFQADGAVTSMALLPDHKKYIKGLLGVLESGIYPFKQIHPLNNYLPRVQSGGKCLWNCGCPQGSTPVISTDGNCYPCIYLHNIDEYCMGNVLKDEHRVFDSPVLKELKRELFIDAMNDCKDCKYRYFCGGGCSIIHIAIKMADKQQSEILKKEYQDLLVCSITKKIIEAALWELESGVITESDKQVDHKPPLCK
jgi:uncharacterized protein